MLERIPNFVKPFFPQLPRTFIKSVSDPVSLVVPTKAREVLGVLMRSKPKITGEKSRNEVIVSSLVISLANVDKSGREIVGDKARSMRGICIRCIRCIYCNS